MFSRPQSRPNFYELEQHILQWWKDNNILEKSIENRPEDQVKAFYDGPITANGAPHHGHMLTFAMKDIIPRFWTMKGFRVSRSLGWDCQGIPVEYEIEKKLGFKEKKDIEEYGVAKFNELCRQSVLEHKDKIIELEEKMGRLTNDEEEYHTMDKDFIESIWWSLKELYTKGHLYEGFKVVPYSTRAGTTLSNAEVALGGYKPVIDPAVTVKFELEEEPNTFVLAWTTTPWTLPTNFALAVGKKIVYSKVQAGDEVFIVAKELVEDVFEGIEYKVVEEIKATDLIGKKYKPLFDYFKNKENAFQISDGFHVTTESGTGIVHLAPYGAEDNEIFQEVGIESIDVLDDQGDFTRDVPDLEAMFYRKANKVIIEKLEKKGLLFKQEDYEHDMPMCWRTNTPLIYKPITSWYIGMSKLRKELVENNAKIHWVPAHVKEGRFGNWLAEIKDWGISRKRYWGTPLPVWKSESGKVKVIGSFEEIEKLTGKKVDDPHKPFIDEFEFELDGEKYTRVTDVIDVWYDSGAMPFARFHYPFENKEKFEAKFPADYIAESVDQTRGWFYSLHAIGTSVFESQAFNNVVMSGFVLDDKGVKLSKSKGNYTAPDSMIEQFGADTIRLNFFSTPISAGEDTTVSEKTLKLQTQETMLPLWNMYKFLVMYAEIHEWQPNNTLAYNERNVTDDDHPWDHIPFDDIDNELDAWVILKLQHTIQNVNNYLNEYQIPKATRTIKELVSEVSKWYIRRSRDRFSQGEERAMDTLYYVFVEILKLLAPFTPFVAEELYQKLVADVMNDAVDSIHLTDYPEADLSFLDQYAAVNSEMAYVRIVSELGHTLRSEQGLKVRQPLSSLEIVNRNEHIPATTEWMQEMLQDELNVRDVAEVINLTEKESIVSAEDSSNNISVGLETELNEDLKMEGLLREVTRNIQSLRKNMKFAMGDRIILEYQTDDAEILQLFDTMKSELMENISAKEIRTDDLSKDEDAKTVKVNGKVILFKLIAV